MATLEATEPADRTERRISMQVSRVRAEYVDFFFTIMDCGKRQKSWQIALVKKECTARPKPIWPVIYVPQFLTT